MSGEESSDIKDKVLNVAVAPVNLVADTLATVNPLKKLRRFSSASGRSPSASSRKSGDAEEDPKHSIDSALSDPEVPQEDEEVFVDANDNLPVPNAQKESQQRLSKLERNDSNCSRNLSPRRILSSVVPKHDSLSLPKSLKTDPVAAITKSAINSTPVNLTKNILEKFPQPLHGNKQDATEIRNSLVSDQNIEGISKSFVDFLTTASVYAGFQDMEGETGDEDDEDDDDDEDDEDDGNKRAKKKSFNDNTDYSKVDLLGLSNLESNNNPYYVSDAEQFLSEEEAQDEDASLVSEKTAVDTTEKIQPGVARKKPRFEQSVLDKLKLKNTKCDIAKKAQALSDKIINDFGIEDDEDFVGNYSCWLLSDVLLQGHLYITSHNILFLAFLPKTSTGSAARTGTLSVQSFPSRRMHRKWAILRGNTLSIYANATDLYFPDVVIDLRSALRAEIDGHIEKLESSEPVWIKIVTSKKTHWFQADNLDVARSWVTMLKKYIFASRNTGDEVAIKIPLQNILDLELTSVIGVTKSLRIKVIENAETFAIDDYFVMFFCKGDEAALEIKNVIENAGIKISNSEEDSTSLMDSELMKSKVELIKNSASAVSTTNLQAENANDIFSTDEEDYALEDNKSDKKEQFNDSSKALIKDVANEDDVSVKTTSALIKEKKKLRPSFLRRRGDSETIKPLRSEDSILKTVVDTTHPVTSPVDNHEEGSKVTKYTKSVFQNIQAFTQGLLANSHICHFENLMEGEDKYYVKNEEVRKASQSRFLKRFSLNESSKLIATYQNYLMKGLPTYGKMYIGDNEICFRSTIPGSSTIMILPLADIENINKEQGFRFGYYGLVILIQGHEELFFEFSSQDARSDCEVQILQTLDLFKKAKASSAISVQQTMVKKDYDESEQSNEPQSGGLSSAKVRMYENKMIDEIGIDIPIIVEDHPYVKTEMKPAKTFRFTFLTIGSRGDVQPYIALGKALLKDGHKVKIVSHGEFEDWVREHGIEFDTIAGDPSALMSLMVSHPTISYSFIKEAKSKFRSWIGDLLESSWKACQDTDVLIESPSSISGIHIAEKLKIPYFRAFTMPWTRTRAYPHAFMVPDQRLGGAYNYMTHVAFENGYWRGTSSQVNKWRVKTLGLPKTSLSQMELTSIPFLYNISPIVFPPSVDFPEWVRVTGYWFLNESTDYTPPKDLLDFIKKAKDDGKKLVYIGFGSIVVENPRELTQSVVDAVLEADVRCILNKGWSDRSGNHSKDQIEVKLPFEVFNAGTVPHDWLFPQVDAAVHHGGSGTTGASLKFGLPTIIKPFFGDQKFYANRVEDLGCGVALKSLSSKELAKALKEVTTSTRIIEKAKLVGKVITSEDGVQTAVDTIYSMMDYAKKVTLRKAEASADAQNLTSESDYDIEEGDEEQSEGAEKSEGSWLLV